ncbi:Copia protein, partial [Mucuna pruriens]
MEGQGQPMVHLLTVKRQMEANYERGMNALEKNNTWEMVDMPKRKNIVDCMWIFTVKYKVDGSHERYKARLVTKG